jgi:uncharacterized protein YukE
MSKAIVDPQELRRFAAELKRFNGSLQAELQGIRRQFSHLGETWRDQEHEQFAEEFDRMVTVLARFLDASTKHVPLLLRKAERIQQYLDER